MPVSPDRRIIKWDIKLEPDTIKEHFQNQKPVMRTYYTDFVRYMYNVELRTKEVLDSEGVRMSYYPMYYNFSRQVAKKLKYTELGGEVLFSELRGIMGIWVARGLSSLILIRILRDVFGIGLTSP
ncbi:MAG: hypothetical protein N2323_03230 [candidate division WOR-3 bacterium]|nr:hypothetical protein [candidate division WOR-3 bacterium]